MQKHLTVFLVQFAGFSSESLCERIMDAQCNILVTAGNVKCFIQLEVWICVFGLTVCLVDVTYTLEIQ